MVADLTSTLAKELAYLFPTVAYAVVSIFRVESSSLWDKIVVRPREPTTNGAGLSLRYVRLKYSYATCTNTCLVFLAGVGGV